MRCSTIMARYNCMQRALTAGILVVLVAAVAWSEKSFTTRGADQYRAKQEQADVVVGVKPYRVEKDVKAAFGKAKPYKHGVLPVLVVITNRGEHSLDLGDLKVRFITADRDGLEPISPEDLAYLKLDTKPKERPVYLPPVPGIWRGGVKKGPLAKPEFELRAFTAPVAPPESTVSGFFYYLTGNLPDPVPGSAIYLSGVRDLNTGKELFYFEISLNPYKGQM